MAAQILWIREQGNGQDMVQDASGKREYCREFLFGVVSPPTSPLAVLSAGQAGTAPASLPQLASLLAPYITAGGDQDLSALARRIRISRDSENWLIYRATVNYDTDVPPEVAQAVTPPLRKWSHEWSFKPYQKIAENTIDNPPKPIQNSAGDAFDPPYEMDDSRACLTIERIEIGFSGRNAMKYRGSTNKLPFLSYPAGLARIANIRGSDLWEYGTRWWKVSYEIDFRDPDLTNDDWQLHLLDQGYHSVVNILGANVRIAMTDKYGVPYQQPQLLDGNGNQLAVGGNPVFRAFQIYKSVDWTDLGLDAQLNQQP